MAGRLVAVQIRSALLSVKTLAWPGSIFLLFWLVLFLCWRNESFYLFFCKNWRRLHFPHSQTLLNWFLLIRRISLGFHQFFLLVTCFPSVLLMHLGIFLKFFTSIGMFGFVPVSFIVLQFKPPFIYCCFSPLSAHFTLLLCMSLHFHHCVLTLLYFSVCLLISIIVCSLYIASLYVSSFSSLCAHFTLLLCMSLHFHHCVLTLLYLSVCLLISIAVCSLYFISLYVSSFSSLCAHFTLFLCMSLHFHHCLLTLLYLSVCLHFHHCVLTLLYFYVCLFIFITVCSLCFISLYVSTFPSLCAHFTFSTIMCPHHFNYCVFTLLFHDNVSSSFS